MKKLSLPVSMSKTNEDLLKYAVYWHPATSQYSERPENWVKSSDHMEFVRESIDGQRQFWWDDLDDECCSWFVLLEWGLKEMEIDVSFWDQYAR